MRRRLIAKGNVHKSDHLRALVTDTLPGDIPIIISNDGFYHNMRSLDRAKVHQRDFINRIMDPPRSYTKPYRYNLFRPGISPRRLSLIHPSGQLGVVELYRQYGELICYHCRKSEASIRSPRKVGALFFVRGPLSDKNRFKTSSIDSVDIETTVSNPASYFSYLGVDRKFKFFNSTEYLHLEKRYAVMQFADVAKCFDSIYTHTLYWAIADIDTAKDNTQAEAFSNTFDRLMQSVNYSETNGICIGAEVSRIFAELILSEVDRRVVASLSADGLKFRVHYEFRRYVDDFFIFCQNDDIAKRVLIAISNNLAAFNLHLGEEKTEKVPRPFITTKSRMIRDANAMLEEFFAKFIVNYKSDGIVYSYPLRVRRSHALLRQLLESMKATCFDNKKGYAEISNYVIGALTTRVEVLALSHGQESRPDTKDDYYISAMMLLLEAIYFFYNVDPTIPSSLRVAQAAILAHEFFEAHMKDRVPYLAEQIIRWTFTFVKELNGSNAHKASGCVPLEAINVLLVLGHIGRGDGLARRAIQEFCSELNGIGYFEVVSYLFCLKDDPLFDVLRDQIFQHAVTLLKGRDKLRTDAHAAHLALDMLACPYISNDKRAILLNELRADMGLGQISSKQAAEAVEAFEESPWFVNWREPNLLAMIRKKELSAVY